MEWTSLLIPAGLGALGMEVAGISMLTNWAAGLKPQTLHHAEVVEVGKAASADLARLLMTAL